MSHVKTNVLDRGLISVFFIVLGLWTTSALAQSRPPTPYYDRGACPFECCTYRQWTVDKATTVRASMRDSSAVAFRLRKGEKVRGLTGVVITTQAGIANVVKPVEDSTWRIPAGERVYLLTNQGEGYVKVWYKGRIFSDEVLNTELFRIEQQPRSVWWVKVRNSRGKVGWSRQPENFGNMDECG